MNKYTTIGLSALVGIGLTFLATRLIGSYNQYLIREKEPTESVTKQSIEERSKLRDLCLVIQKTAKRNEIINFYSNNALVEFWSTELNLERRNLMFQRMKEYDQRAKIWENHENRLIDICFDEKKLGLYRDLSDCSSFVAKYNILNEPDMDITQICN